MSIQQYPPLIDSKLPAFIVDDSGETNINVPYLLNRAVALSDFNQMVIRLKTVTTGALKLEKTSGACKTQTELTKQYYSTFTFDNDENSDTSLETFTPIAGSYYKVQIAFKNGSIQSPWSSVGVIKCTNAPNVSISSLTSGIDNLNPSFYVGTYTNTDSSEKLYTYNFTIYDEYNKIYETSGDLLHNSSNDEVSSAGVQSTVQWKPLKQLPEGCRYTVAFSTTTINNYTKTSQLYYIVATDTIDARIPARLLAEPDFDNGRILLTLINDNDSNIETPFTGNFVISRYSENLNTWNEVCRFNMLSQSPSDIGLIWTDYTIEHGVKYLYAIQAYNSHQLYSNRLYHVIKNPNTTSSKKYLDFDEMGKPYYIMADFEDMFLTDGERQLRIRYNPKVSSYKTTILENKVETLVSKYPFIFRNGYVNYKEFPISGLLSYLVDDKELFMNGIMPDEYNMSRSKTPAAAGEMSRQEWLSVSQAGSKLTSDNFYRERQFKMTVLEWLNNGQPKLFRSPAEGNCIVRLMNTSISPEETLGRMLHTFSTTAYEIDDYTFDNLNKYNLLAIPDIDNRVMKFQEALIGETYSPGHNMYHVYITNATPGTKYILGFNSLPENATASYTIGITGTLYLDVDMAPLSSITLVDGDWNETAKIHYGYYDTAVPDNFSHVAQITSYDEISQIIGYDETKNIIEDKLEDIRRDVGTFSAITIKPREIIPVYKNGSTFYKDSKLTTPVGEDWADINIYYVVNDKKYYSGEPLIANLLGTEPPKKYFKFNDLYILDLSTGNAYMVSDTLANDLNYNPLAQEHFRPATTGSYQVIGNFGSIHSLKLTPGVYVELTYRLKEIEYSIEALPAEVQQAKNAYLEAKKLYEENDSEENENAMEEAYEEYEEVLTEKWSSMTDVAKAREDWFGAKVQYEESYDSADKATMNSKYNIYITKLETALENAEVEDGNYVL